MQKSVLFIILLSTVTFLNTKAFAVEEFSEADDMSLEDLLEIETDVKANIGSRGNSVDLLKTKVPIDVVTAEQINHTGHTELSKVLQRFIPGFNFPRAATNNGTDHIRPFTLRGMAPDQVLVLVNGKRQHSSSVLHVNGSIGRGSTGVDLNAIPLHSIERVEVLRDGAAAQYGSDAIAGIINIILKSASEGHRLTTTIGKTYVGDGDLYQTDINSGFELPMDGFVNITAEFRNRSFTNRSIADDEDPYFPGDIRNNKPFQVTGRQGDPDTQDIVVAINSELPVSESIIVYLQGNLNYRESEASGFFRRPKDDRNVRSIYPDGFLPLISPEILDYSATTGLKGETNANINWGLSHTVGGNTLDYYIKNSLNTSLGADSPTSFDAGGLEFRQHITNLDLFKTFDFGLKNPVKIATGFEWRYEMFAIHAGEESSYIQGGVPILDGPNAGAEASSGSQVFSGFEPKNELTEDRHSFATYLDLETELIDSVTANLAGRYEYFSDFGSSINGKFSLSYQVIDDVLLRSSVSTGFRAPSLQQSYFNETTTLVNLDGSLNEATTLSIDSPIAQALGATSLKPEKSEHFTAGFVYTPIKNFFFSADYFYTKIKNRITFSRNISSSEILGEDILSLIPSRFFSNSIDTETQGYDLRSHYKFDLQNYGDLKLSAGYHYNQNKVSGAVRSPDILGAEGSNIILSAKDRERLEVGQPNDSLILTSNYKIGDFESVVKLIKSGAFSDQEERPNSQWLTDIDLSYQLHENFNLAIGAHNLFDSEPERNLQDGEFARSSPYGYNGGFYYLRLTVDL